MSGDLIGRRAHRILADARALEEEGERANPIKRGAGNPRLSRKALGDMRALEEEAARAVQTTGSTPDVLSRVRGGARHRSPSSSSSESEEEEKMVGGAHIIGAGRRRVKKESEAKEMGYALGQHLHSLHGAGFWSDFKDGFLSVVKPAASIAKVFLPSSVGNAMSAVGLGYGSQARAGEVAAEKQTIIEKAEGVEGGLATGAYKGRGRPKKVVEKPMKKGKGVLRITHGEEEMKGKGVLRMTHGGAKVDGRKARAEIVKRVMKEKGMKMVEASKYVKEHGLYKKA